MSYFLSAETGMPPTEKPVAEQWRLPINMSPEVVRSLCSAIARILRDQTGATATIVAIALPCLIGMSALGVESGIWFAIKLQNQSAADSAAISAAYEVIAGKADAIGELTAAAGEAARRNGYKGSVPEIATSYSDGIVTNGVAVTLQQSHGSLLAAMFLSGVTITNTAVAVIEVLNNPCILALGTNSTDVEIAASTRLDMPNCSVAANSIGSTAIELRNSTSGVTAATLVSAGEISLQGTPIDPAAPPPEFALSSAAMIGAARVADPYADTLTHDFLIAGLPAAPACIFKITGQLTIYAGNCTIPGKSLTDPQILLSANTRISGSWHIASGQTVDLSPGTYWVTGDLTLRSRAVLRCSTCDNAKGTGVTIILIAQANKIGAVSVASRATLTLNAPRSGPFAGLAIIQDSNGLPQGTTYTSHNWRRPGGGTQRACLLPQLIADLSRRTKRHRSAMFDARGQNRGHRCCVAPRSRRMRGRWPKQSSRNRDSRRCGVKMPKRFSRDCGGRRGEIGSGCGNQSGSVAAEFALMAPILVLIATGIADFGMLATRSVGLAATARIGAEYARAYPADNSGIQHAMQSATSFGPALTFPASFPRSCECDDETPITCSESCATVGRPGPNRMFIRITANQPFSPLVPWPGIPAMLTAATEVRLQ